MNRRSERTSVEKLGDELCIGVKGQSNLEIAGSPRNEFRLSLGVEFYGGRALDGLGAPHGYQTQPNSEYRKMLSGSEAAGDKLRRREGNNPDHQLRSPSHAKW